MLKKLSHLFVQNLPSGVWPLIHRCFHVSTVTVIVKGTVMEHGDDDGDEAEGMVMKRKVEGAKALVP